MIVVSFSVPEIETERLRLRLPRASDLDAHAAFRASDKARYLGGPHDRANAWTHLATEIGAWQLNGHGRWIVADRESDEPLGFVGIHDNPEWPEPEIGWVVYLGHEGRGIAYEAACATRSFAYETLNWTRIVSLVDDANTRSVALARRMQCVDEGLYDHPRHGPLRIWRHLSPQEVAA